MWGETRHIEAAISIGLHCCPNLVAPFRIASGPFGPVPADVGTNGGQPRQGQEKAVRSVGIGGMDF